MIARFINRHWSQILLLTVVALAAGVAFGLSGCYMQDREAFRPAPQQTDVMADLQDTADTDPLEGMSR